MSSGKSPLLYSGYGPVGVADNSIGIGVSGQKIGSNNMTTMNMTSVSGAPILM